MSCTTSYAVIVHRIRNINNTINIGSNDLSYESLAYVSLSLYLKYLLKSQVHNNGVIQPIQGLILERV